MENVRSKRSRLLRYGVVGFVGMLIANLAFRIYWTEQTDKSASERPNMPLPVEVADKALDVPLMDPESDNTVPPEMAEVMRAPFRPSLETRENADFLLTPPLLIQQMISEGVVVTYPEE